MKKIFLSIIALLLATNIFAQETTSSPPKAEFYKHEVGITYGALAMPWFPLTVYPLVLGSLNLDYYYNFNKWNSIGFGTSFTSGYLNSKMGITSNFLLAPYEGNYSNIYSIHLGYRITYAQKGIVSFYASASLGALFMQFIYTNTNITEQEPWMCWMDFHVTFFGMTIGKKNCATIELGLGTKGVLQVGYKYRFNPKKTK